MLKFSQGHQQSFTHCDVCSSCVCWDYYCLRNDIHKPHTCTVFHPCETSCAPSVWLILYIYNHTHHTCKEFPRCEHACVSSYHQLGHTCTHTAHIWMEVPVCVSTCDVSSYLIGWNISHTQCTCRVVPLCEFEDVFLNHLFVWNFYHSAHMWRAYYLSVLVRVVWDHNVIRTSSHIFHIYISSLYCPTHLLHYTLLLVSSCITSCAVENVLRDRSRDRTTHIWTRKLKHQIIYQWWIFTLLIIPSKFWLKCLSWLVLGDIVKEKSWIQPLFN